MLLSVCVAGLSLAPLHLAEEMPLYGLAASLDWGNSGCVVVSLAISGVTSSPPELLHICSRVMTPITASTIITPKMERRSIRFVLAWYRNRQTVRTGAGATQAAGSVGFLLRYVERFVGAMAWRLRWRLLQLWVLRQERWHGSVQNVAVSQFHQVRRFVRSARTSSPTASLWMRMGEPSCNAVGVKARVSLRRHPCLGGDNSARSAEASGKYASDRGPKHARNYAAGSPRSGDAKRRKDHLRLCRRIDPTTSQKRQNASP